MEKFYYYVEWLRYLIDNILAPRGYILNGDVEYCEDGFEQYDNETGNDQLDGRAVSDCHGWIFIRNNFLTATHPEFKKTDGEYYKNKY